MSSSDPLIMTPAPGGRGTALLMGILIVSVGIAVQSWRLLALGGVLVLVGGWFAFFSDFGR